MRARKYVGAFAACGFIAAVAFAGTASAETLKLAVGQRGNWDTAIAELGQNERPRWLTCSPR